MLANYNLTAAFAEIPTSQPHPTTDFYGNARPEPGTNDGRFDPGAVEFGSSPPTGGGGGGAGTGTLSFTGATNGTLTTFLGVRILTFTVSTRTPVTSALTITNTGTGPLNITAETLTLNFGGLFSIVAGSDTCVASSPIAAGGTCTVSIRYATPAVRPFLPNLGGLGVTNDGTGGGTSILGLVAQ
jgi:hypothetical protein